MIDLEKNLHKTFTHVAFNYGKVNTMRNIETLYDLESFAKMLSLIASKMRLQLSEKIEAPDDLDS